MATKYLYDNGLPFSTVLKVNLDDQIDRIKRKKASCIIIDGGLGEGKTTLGVEIGDYFEAKPINLKTQIGMGGEDFQAKFSLGIKKGVVAIIYDEAGDFDRRGAIGSFNRMINRLFQIYRGFKIIVILCLPNFSILDTRFLEARVPRLLLNCHNRSATYGDIRGYDLDGMFYLKKYMENKRNVPLKAYKYVRPNFRAHFKDLPSERSNVLDGISTAAKNSILDINIGKKEGVSVAEIAKDLDMSVSWTHAKIKELKIKSQATVKNVNYYDPVLFAELRPHVRQRRN